jgi:hypothetical protein
MTNKDKIRRTHSTPNHHLHHHGIPTPGEIIRKLSHSKIIVHMPSLGSYVGGNGEKKDGVLELISIEEPEEIKIGVYNGGATLDEDEDEDDDDLPPEIKMKSHTSEPGKKSLKWKIVKGLPCAKYLGLMLALLSSILISLVTLIVKSLPQYHPLSLVIWRLQGVLLPSIILMSYLKGGKGVDLFQPVWPLSSWNKWSLIIILAVSWRLFSVSGESNEMRLRIMIIMN